MLSKRKTSETCAELDKWSGSSGDSTASGTPSPDSTTTSDSDGSTHGLKHPERRRQGWRNCARTRRHAEAGAFQDLALALPLSRPEQRELDRMAVLRVALCYTKLRGLVEHLQPKVLTGESLLESLGLDVEGAALLGQDAFLIITATSGELLYVTENCSKWFLKEKHAILGSSLYDHIHDGDRNEVDHLLHPTTIQQLQTSALKDRRHTALVRLASGSGQLRISGKLFMVKGRSCFVGVGEPLSELALGRLTHPNDNGYPLPHPQFRIVVSYDFVCTMDMKMFYAGPKAQQFLGYSVAEMFGVSGYEIAHPDSAEAFEEWGKKLCAGGSHQSRCYQVLIKGGGWAWFVTQGAERQTQVKAADGSTRAITYLAGRDFMVSEVYEREKVFGAIQLDPWSLKPQPQQAESPGSWWELALSWNEEYDSYDYLDEMLRMLDDGGGVNSQDLP